MAKAMPTAQLRQVMGAKLNCFGKALPGFLEGFSLFCFYATLVMLRNEYGIRNMGY